MATKQHRKTAKRKAKQSEQRERARLTEIVCSGARGTSRKHAATMPIEALRREAAHKQKYASPRPIVSAYDLASRSGNHLDSVVDRMCAQEDSLILSSIVAALGRM